MDTIMQIVKLGEGAALIAISLILILRKDISSDLIKGVKDALNNLSTAIIEFKEMHKLHEDRACLRHEDMKKQCYYSTKELQDLIQAKTDLGRLQQEKETLKLEVEKTQKENLVILERILKKVEEA